jgi:hypothetical protein
MPPVLTGGNLLGICDKNCRLRSLRRIFKIDFCEFAEMFNRGFVIRPGSLYFRIKLAKTYPLSFHSNSRPPPQMLYWPKANGAANTFD